MNSHKTFFNSSEFGYGSCEFLKICQITYTHFELICWIGVIKFSQIWLHMYLYEVFELYSLTNCGSICENFLCWDP